MLCQKAAEHGAFRTNISTLMSRTHPTTRQCPGRHVGPDPTHPPLLKPSHRRHCAASQWRAARRLRTNPARESNPNLARKKSPSCSRESYRPPSTLTSASPVSRPRPHAPAATPTHCPAALHCWSMAGGRAARPTLLARATHTCAEEKSERHRHSENTAPPNAKWSSPLGRPRPHATAAAPVHCSAAGRRRAASQPY